MVPTLFNIMLPVLLIQLAYLTGHVASTHIKNKQLRGKPFCLGYYTFGYSLVTLGLSILAILNVLGVL